MKKLADNYVKSRRRYVDPNELRQDFYSQYGLEDIKLSEVKKLVTTLMKNYITCQMKNYRL